MLTASEEEMAVYSVFVGKKKPAEILLEDGDVISFGKSSLKVIHTPGHTKGGICLYGGGCLFSGDTLFASSVGRTDLPGGDYHEILHSVNVALAQVADETKVYPGHGVAIRICSKDRWVSVYRREGTRLLEY